MERSVWRVSAEASLQEALDEPGCPALLVHVLRTIHSWQVRNETILSRTLKSSRLMPHWTAALIALDAVVTLEGEEGTVEVPLEDLVRHRRKGRLVSVQVPQARDVRWGEAHVARTPSDGPIVSASAVVWARDGMVEDARIVLSGASTVPVWIADAADGLVGRPLTEQSIEAVVPAVMDEVEPEADYLGSAEYRREIAGVLTRRALKACLRPEVGDE